MISAHKYAQAIDLYTQAIELNSQNAVYWANRSIAHLKLEEYGSAILDASKAIEVDPRYSKACFVRLNVVHHGMHDHMLIAVYCCRDTTDEVQLLLLWGNSKTH